MNYAEGLEKRYHMNVEKVGLENRQVHRHRFSNNSWNRSSQKFNK